MTGRFGRFESIPLAARNPVAPCPAAIVDTLAAHAEKPRVQEEGLWAAGNLSAGGTGERTHGVRGGSRVLLTHEVLPRRLGIDDAGLTFTRARPI